MGWCNSPRSLSPILRAEGLARRWGHRASVWLRPISRPPSHRDGFHNAAHISQSVPPASVRPKGGRPSPPQVRSLQRERLVGKPSLPGSEGSLAPLLLEKPQGPGALQGGHTAREGPASAYEFTIGTAHSFLFEKLCVSQQWVTFWRQRDYYDLKICMPIYPTHSHLNYIKKKVQNAK